MSVNAAPKEVAVQEVLKLNEQALALYDKGQYQDAMPLAQRAVDVSKQALGPRHPEMADALSTLAQLHTAAGAYAEAEPLYEQALKIRKTVLGLEHAKTADALYDLALLYYLTGAYAQAEPLQQQALQIRQKLFGPQHPKTADSLNGLAGLYHEIGNYAKAEPLYQQALAIRRQVLGPEHRKTAGSLNNLALLYAETGAYADAEPLYQQALKIQEKTLGRDHPMICHTLNNLAVLYYDTGIYAKAEPLYRRALEINEKTLGPEHPNTAGTLDNLANVYNATGAYAKAKPLYERALRIFEKELGPEHPQTAISLGNLALLYSETGAYAKAEPLYQRSLAIVEKTLGREHPNTADGLNALADFYSATGAAAKAEPLYQRAQVVIAKNSERFLLTSSESRQREYLEVIRENTRRNVSFSVSAHSRGAIALGLTSVLQYKGRVLDEVSGSVARLRRSVRPADRAIFDRLAGVANEFSTLTYQGIGDLSPAQYRQRLNELTQQQDALEADLAKRSVEFRRQVTPVTLTAVSRAIPAGAVLVEWLRYHPFNPKAPRANAQQGSARYVAYVLKAGTAPSVVDVGDAQAIETLVQLFLKAVQDPTSSDVKERARRLSDKVIKPLRGYLNGAQRVLMSPDGSLNLVPMAALLDENGQYLVQRLELTYLTSGRDLLRTSSASASQSGAIVIGDPDYGKPVRLPPPVQSLALVQRSAELDRSGVFFKQLPNTVREAQAIKSLLKLGPSSVLTGADATEANLKQLHGPRILHVATHGFFLSDQELAAELGPNAEQVIRKGENPLLRAGIALTGANTRRSGANDDGILTALEAAQLDLQGTELVVLSACETGVGQVHNGEGVYGLRRALFIAGAQSQIATLWKVVDRTTSTLMVDYYQRLLKGDGRSAALREVQQKMLATRPHPYYWAGFVSIGNWAPLAGKP